MRIAIKHARGSYEVETTSMAHVLTVLREDDFVVTDTNVRRTFGTDVECFVIEAGEPSKSLEEYKRLLDWIARRGDRSSRIVAIGGGVVGDLAGFVAATYMRGIQYVHVATSLLAMVDSSVGGKVAVNLPSGKNLVGAFWPPAHVFLPIDALETLPDREFTNGTAEVWKYGYIADPSIVDRLAREPLKSRTNDIGDLITKCVDIKRRVVEEDEYERTGKRAVLNFGHTVGHAIEQCQNYGGLSHGEAVAVGMIVETQIAEKLGIANAGLAEVMRGHLESQGLPTQIPSRISSEGLLAAMARDKKSVGSSLALSLVSKIGDCRLHTGVDRDRVAGVLRSVCR